MFKKILGLTMAAVLVFSLSACGQTQAESSRPAGASEAAVSSEAQETSASGEAETASASESEPAEAGAGNTLVVYFSWSGNTEEMAAYIAEQTGGDLYEITPQTPYPEDYNETAEIAEKERNENARPAMADLPDAIDQYDTIVLGYPIWLAYHKLIQCTQLA